MYEEEAPERRLYKLRAGEEDEWRELWVWGYVFTVFCWLFIAPRLKATRFPWCVKDRPMTFLQTRRRFERFVGDSAKEPRLPQRPFQHKYLPTRPFLYSGIVRTAVLRGHSFILGSGALALALCWWLRSAYYVSARNPTWKTLDPDIVRLNFASGAQAYKVMVPLTSFMLTLYLVFYVSRLYRIMDLAWKVQGRIYDFAILIGTLLMPYAEDESVQRALWQVHRHLNLAHVLTYEEVSDDVKKVTSDMSTLLYSGLLEENETVEFNPQISCRVTVVFVWLSDLANKLVEAQIVPRVFSVPVLEALTELSDVTLEFQNEVIRAPPAIVDHAMQYMADMMCLLTPAMLAHIFNQRDPSTPTYFWPWAGSMVVAFFFQGITHLAQALEMPFKDHRDGLDPDWALATTERQTFGCLSGGEVGGPAPPEPLNLMQASGTGGVLASAAGPMTMGPTGTMGSFGSPAAAATSVTGFFPPGTPGHAAMIPGERSPGADMAGTSSFPDFAMSGSPMAAMAATPHSVGSGLAMATPRSAGGGSVTSGYGRRSGRGLPVPETQLLQMRKEKVPLETMPGEAPWAPREMEVRNRDAGQWGVLSQDLLQATRAALLVPREITLDDVSMERLETVTARPLSELAAALLNVDTSAGPEGESLMLTDSGGPQGHTSAPHDHGRTDAMEVPTEGNARQLKELFDQYHGQLRQNSDIRAQVTAIQSGLSGVGHGTGAPMASRDSSREPPPPRQRAAGAKERRNPEYGGGRQPARGALVTSNQLLTTEEI